MEKNAARIPVAELEKFCLAALRKCGLSATDAKTTVDVLVTTDTLGVFTHGTKCLRGYVRRLQAGGLKADAKPAVVKEGPAWAIVDGESAIAMVTSTFAMNTAIRKAKTAGLGYVGVRNSCHFGAAGHYALLAAQSDMIGMAMANDCPSMAVPGSRKPVLGTNPFAWAVPAGKENPVFLDIASSAVAAGKVWSAQTLKKKVPDTWLIDAEGVPTTDPFLYPHSASMMSFAGHKGYGIALMIETLSSMLSGAASRFEVLSWMLADPSLPTLHGAAFLAIDIGAMQPIDTFKARMDKMIRDIRETPKAKGSDRIYLPGEMEWEKRKEHLKTGLPLPEDVLVSLRGLAEDTNIKADWLRS